MQRWRLAALFLGVAIVLIATNAILYSNFDNVRNAQFWMTRSLEVLQELGQLETNVNEVESSARGYMLTHKESLLSDIKASEKLVWGHYGKALNKTGDNPQQQRD
jgi:CHASE3 domain sensor protein